MNDILYIYATVAVVVGLFAWQVFRKTFDPFSPIWLFLTGYVQLYVIQALSTREWAIGIRGQEIVAAANFRIFWALLWFLAVYHLVPAKWLSKGLPTPPRAWSVMAVWAFSPFLIAWGIVCALAVIRQSMGVGEDPNAISAEAALFRSFPFVLMVAGILLLVSGRIPDSPNRAALAVGLLIPAGYVLVWMFNGKRSHALIGILSAVCAYYTTRQKRPSWPVLITTAVAGALVVSLAIGWRNNPYYERSASGFIQYVGDFEPSKILAALNVQDDEEVDLNSKIVKSYETLEYGGFLLMLDTVPEKTDHDFGACYLRCFSTFIPRIFWPDKPLYGREQWIKAWQAGSELKREDDFTGPAIGLLGATQLNGGAVATVIVLGFLALGMRVGYAYFLRYADVPWVQAWWALTYFNAWFTVVGDDPSTWFYYNYGFSVLPTLGMLWVVNSFAGAGASAPAHSPVAVSAGI